MQGTARSAFRDTLIVAVLHASTTSKADSKCGLQIVNSRPSPVSPSIQHESQFKSSTYRTLPPNVTGLEPIRFKFHNTFHLIVHSVSICLEITGRKRAIPRPYFNLCHRGQAAVYVPYVCVRQLAFAVVGLLISRHQGTSCRRYRRFLLSEAVLSQPQEPLT